MALLVVLPVLRIDALLLSIPFLGLEVTVLRVATAGAAALTRKVVDHRGPWILLGLFVAAVVAPGLEGGWLARLPWPVGVLLFAAIGFPTYVRAAAANPIVAALVPGGLSPGAAITFLITGPATNLSSLAVMAGLHRRRAAVAFATALVDFSIVAGLTVDAVFGGRQIPELKNWTDEPPSWIALVSLAGLVGLFGASLLRRGPRQFVGEVRARADDHGDHHHHGAAPGHS